MTNTIDYDLVGTEVLQAIRILTYRNQIDIRLKDPISELFLKYVLFLASSR